MTTIDIVVEPARPPGMLAHAMTANIFKHFWELGSWWMASPRAEDTGAHRTRTHRAKDLIATEHQAACSWLWEEAGHRKALFDRIGGSAHQG
jgi:hypothetical protein